MKIECVKGINYTLNNNNNKLSEFYWERGLGKVVRTRTLPNFIYISEYTYKSPIKMASE